MKADDSVQRTARAHARGARRRGRAALAAAAGLLAAAAAVEAQQPFSYYIPTAVPTATVALLSPGPAPIAPGRVAVDRAGNTFFVGHTAGSPSTLFELPAPASLTPASGATPLVSGLGADGSNSAFVDASGNLWVANGDGGGGALIEVPAGSGTPNTASITGDGGYAATGLPLANVPACTAGSSGVCTWSASSIDRSLTALEVGDVYADGAGNVYVVDISDSVSSGAYNRVAEFSALSPGTLTVLADRLTANPYAQVTVAGDGNVYYCDCIAGNSGGGLTSLVGNGSLVTVGNSPAASLTLLNGNVKVAAATGITSDPWGNLIISGPIQLSEVPLENGALNFLDQFNLLLAASGANAPVYSNNIAYGGSFDVHGDYVYATPTGVFQIQVGGVNFGSAPVGQQITTGAPYLNITWSLPSKLQTSFCGTSSPSTLSATDAAYLQSFPFSNQKNYFGGTGYSAANPGQYAQMYFQPVYPGLMRGALSPQGYSNALGATDPDAASDFYNSGAYVANLQGVGVGPSPMFVPGTPSQAVTASEVYTSYNRDATVLGFTPTSVAVDSFGDLFVTDTNNTSLDLDCPATTADTAQNYRAGAAGNGYTNSYCLTNGLAATNGTNLTGSTFIVGATGVGGMSFPTSFVTPVDVVVDGANDAYVLDSGFDTAAVTLFPFGTMIPRVVIPANTAVAGQTITAPQGLAIDGYGNLYIADTGNSRILEGRQYNAQYSQNIVYVPPSTTFDGTPLNGPTGLGLDAAGDLFIADTGNSRIVEYSVTGVASVVGLSGVTLRDPTAVKVLPSGALVVADSTLGLVLIDGGTAAVLSTGSIPLSSTQGLSLDAMGNIYVADPAGSQVVALKTGAPAALSFPDTLKPDDQGSHSSAATSSVYDMGNSALVFAAGPVVADNTTSATNEFSVDPANSCGASASLSPGASCSLTLDFSPTSTAAVYTTVTGVATVADNEAPYTLIVSPANSTQAIGSFGPGPGTQTVSLSGNPVVPFTPQTIDFAAPAPVSWSASIPPIQLVATGGATGNPVVFSIVRGGGVLSGPNNSILTLTGIGTTVIAANQAGALVNGIYYSAAPEVMQSVVVNPVGTVDTPTFSVPGGTYTAVQSVTISDATAGAVIHYTTNGNPPTPSSPVYGGTPIAIGVTTRLQAIAEGAPGYAPSAVQSATYVLNPDFDLKPYQTSFTIPNGLSGSTTILLTPLFAFTGTVSLSCSGMNPGDSCSFLDGSGNPVTKLSTIGGAPVYGTLTIQTSEGQTAAHRAPPRPFAPLSALAGVLLIGAFARRRRPALLVVLLAGLLPASAITGCGDPSTTGKAHTSTFTLTSTSGSITHTTTITLNVDNL